MSSKVYSIQNVSSLPQNVICELLMPFLVSQYLEYFPRVTFLFLNTTLTLNLVRKQVILRDLTCLIAQHKPWVCFRERRDTAVSIHRASAGRDKQNKAASPRGPLPAATFVYSSIEEWNLLATEILKEHMVTVH